MNKRFSQTILKFFLLLILVFSSGCGPVTAVPSPTIVPSETLTPAPSQTPTSIATVTPSLTNTPEPIRPKGTIFYSDFNTLYSVDLQSQKTKIILSSDSIKHYLITNSFIYIPLNTHKDNQGKADWEIFKMKFDGSQPEQLTIDGVIEEYDIDPNEKYLTYNNYDRVLKILDIANKTSEVIAKPSKNSEWVWAYSWSPDGTKLIYSKILDPAGADICALFIYDTDKKLSITLLPDKNISCNAKWSPDGAFIVVAMSDGRNKTGFYLLKIMDNSIKQVLLNADWVLFDGFIWSTNGKRILVSTNKAIYSYEVDSDKLEEISSSLDLNAPAVASPDGKMLLYQDDRTSTSIPSNLCLLNIDTKNTLKIHGLNSILNCAHGCNLYDWDFSPIWSPDGKYFVYFTPTVGENGSISHLFLDIYDVKTGGSTSFEVLTSSIGSIFSKKPYWFISN